MVYPTRPLLTGLKPVRSTPYYVEYPCLQVRPYGLLAYNKREYHYRPSKIKTETDEEAIEPTPAPKEKGIRQYTGTLTPFAKKRLKRAIQLLVASSLPKEAINFKTGKTFKFKVNFITLTLPCAQGNISDKDLKRYGLDNWIKRMRRKYGLNNYVWRAERQKNGNLHFHMITDTYLRYDKIRDNWNDLLNHFNMIDEFEKKHGHRNPNSTDVHAIHKVKNLTQYFIKYMTKGCDQQDEINGKLWDCSRSLKLKKNCEMLMDEVAEATWRKAHADLNVRILDDPHFSIIFMNEKQFRHHVTGKVLRAWQEYLSEIRNDNKKLVRE